MVPGEGEILGQVRAAYEAGAPGPVLDRLFRQALHAGKKVRVADGDRREPGLGLVRRGGARAAGVRRPRRAAGSCSSAPGKVERAGRAQPRLARRARSRSSPTGPPSAPPSSRERFGARAAAARPSRGRARARRRRRLVDERARLRARARATSTRRCRARKGRPLFLIDLAVPRDLDPGDPRARRLLPLRHRRPRGRRRGEPRRPPARGRARGGDRRRGGRAVPRVAGVARRRPGDRVAARARRGDPRRRARAGRLARPLRRASGAPSSRSPRRSSNKLLHLPTVRMKQAAVAADGVVYADAVRHLFGLGEERALTAPAS